MIFYNLKLKDLFDIYIWIENEAKDFFSTTVINASAQAKTETIHILYPILLITIFVLFCVTSMLHVTSQCFTALNA